MSVVDDIAKTLGVSTATVSRALNDRPGVGSKLREQVLAKARELNYTPTLTARGLATSQTFNIGFFFHQKPGLPASADPFTARSCSAPSR
ncbi:MAG: LacI family DNA-binding transcriptional regulator [Chloroflexi bacterium]|nr:LacI family DNA-binding transcriptional regulator [Chloroflexota bacterium]